MDRYGDEKDPKTLIRQGNMAKAMELTGGKIFPQTSAESESDSDDRLPPIDWRQAN